jgi:hypothetical protein
MDFQAIKGKDSPTHGTAFGSSALSVILQLLDKMENQHKASLNTMRELPLLMAV